MIASRIRREVSAVDGDLAVGAVEDAAIPLRRADELHAIRVDVGDLVRDRRVEKPRGRERSLAIDVDWPRAVHAEPPLRDVIVVRAPVRQVAAGVVVEPAEVPDEAMLVEWGTLRRAEVHVPVEARRRVGVGIPAAGRIPPDRGADLLDFSDPAVAHELAGVTELVVRSLLAARLENAVVATWLQSPSPGLPRWSARAASGQYTSFPDSQAAMATRACQ
jgi:hypothetical protein